ncbi:uncharacterized protein DDB_G0290301-like [Vidua macroura]|uniref:uncharacterized protein DDB_G0290301-like n=1 Tax=Vidua macroura TaxID=187451 RepID=UPI0023A8E132|nr:uncharacterized protein DDB_G0290301-like [Vidua macroura]
MRSWWHQKVAVVHKRPQRQSSPRPCSVQDAQCILLVEARVSGQLHTDKSLVFSRVGVNLRSSATMIEQFAAAFVTAYGVSYSAYYLTNLARHVKHVFSGADAKILPEKEQEQIALSEMPCQTQEELRAREQEEQLRQQVEEPQENGQNIKAEPQAELPEAQSAITEVKKRNQEDTRRIQEEMNLHQQRGDQQNQVSERVAATPLMKHPLSCILENLKEQLDTDFQKAHAKIKAREKRQEEEMKIIREKFNPLPQALQKQVQVLTSHRAAGKDFRQMSGTEEPRGVL